MEFKVPRKNKFRHRDMKGGWALEKSYSSENAYILIAPEGTEEKPVIKKLKTLPGNNGNFIVHPDFGIVEFYFTTHLFFNEVLDELCKLFGLEKIARVKKKNQGRYKKPVIQYDDNWNIIAEHGSILEAAMKTGINPGNICTAVKYGKSKAGGYRWKYKQVTSVSDTP